VASFHPQASAQATLGIAANRQKWFAVFISAGTLGMALGPAYFALVLERFPIESAWLGAIPGVAIAAMLLVWLPGPGAEAASVRKRVDWTPLAAVWKPLSLLYALVFIRSIVQVTYAQSLVLYLSRERGFTFTQSTFALSLYLTAGALGGFVGGHLADRFGGRRVIMISMIGCVPFLCLFFLATGTLALVGLALGGLFLLFTIPVNVVMAQELVPSQAGTVSALMMGFAWGMAGLIFIPLTGWVADHTSMNTALSALSLFPVLGFFLTLKLPKNL
jgi:FSR family fosmidomycin resistance protein-like MFS transporter